MILLDSWLFIWWIFTPSANRQTYPSLKKKKEKKKERKRETILFLTERHSADSIKLGVKPEEYFSRLSHCFRVSKSNAVSLFSRF